jgi:predicted RNase H-like HicB family nuclease
MLNMGEIAIRLHVEPLEEGGYAATSPDVPGLVAQGRSMTETVEIAQRLARKIAESFMEHVDPVPTALAALVSEALAVDPLIPVGMP